MMPSQGSPDEREIARLRALNRLAESTNQAPDVQSLFNKTLETMLGVMTLKTAWISLKTDNGILERPPVHPRNMVSSLQPPATCHPAWKNPIAIT